MLFDGNSDLVFRIFLSKQTTFNLVMYEQTVILLQLLSLVFLSGSLLWHFCHFMPQCLSVNCLRLSADAWLAEQSLELRVSWRTAGGEAALCSRTLQYVWTNLLMSKLNKTEGLFSDGFGFLKQILFILLLYLQFHFKSGASVTQFFNFFTSISAVNKNTKFWITVIFLTL